MTTPGGPKKYTAAEKQRARALYEIEGWTIDQIVSEIGANKGTVLNWKKRNKWGIRGGGVSSEEETQAIQESDTIVEYERIIAELRAANEAQAARLADQDPNLYLNLYTTEAEVVKYYEDHIGPRALRDSAMSKLNDENNKRYKQGLEKLPVDEEAVKSMIQQITAQRLRQRTIHRGKFRQRVLKMARKYEGYPEWRLIQVPVEGQIENEAGQAGTAIAKAKAKGYKIVSPHLCQARDCWEIAAFDASGKLSLNGYCRPECRATDPYLNMPTTDGVSGVQAGVLDDPSRQAGVPRQGMRMVSG